MDPNRINMALGFYSLYAAKGSAIQKIFVVKKCCTTGLNIKFHKMFIKLSINQTESQLEKKS